MFLAGQGKNSEEGGLDGLLEKMRKVSLAGRASRGLITLTGILLVFSIGYDFTELWILVKLIAVISAVAIGALLSGKAYREIETSRSDIALVKTQLGLIARNSGIVLGAAAVALIAAFTQF